MLADARVRASAKNRNQKWKDKIKAQTEKQILHQHKASGESGVGRDFKGREGPLAHRLPLSKKVERDDLLKKYAAWSNNIGAAFDCKFEIFAHSH